MMSRRAWIFRAASLILFSFFLLGTQDATAAEIRVVDEQGLTRAVKQTEESTEIIVSLSNANSFVGESVSLQDISGLQAQQVNAINERGTVHFSEISSGTWQILNVPDGASIRSVKIVDPPQ